MQTSSGRPEAFRPKRPTLLDLKLVASRELAGVLDERDSVLACVRGGGGFSLFVVVVERSKERGIGVVERSLLIEGIGATHTQKAISSGNPRITHPEKITLLGGSVTSVFAKSKLRV